MRLNKEHRNYIRACVRFFCWIQEHSDIDPLQHPKVADLFAETLPLTTEEISILDKQLLESEYNPVGVYTTHDIAIIINQKDHAVRKYIKHRQFQPVKQFGGKKLYSDYTLHQAHKHFIKKDSDFIERFHLDEDTK